MTPEEAKTKRCCGPVGSGLEIKDGSGTGWRRVCIGPDCMAWRWNETVWSTKSGNFVSRQLNPDDVQLPETGYCGLVSKDGSP